MDATHGTVVSFSYILKNDAGDVLDESQEPLEYLHGYGNIIPGLEKALEGATVGNRRSVVVEASEAYGERDPERVMTLRRDSAEDGMELQPGMRVVGETNAGQVALIVCEVNDDCIVVDANHPLAGERLHFDVDIAGVRAASEEELAQGYPG